MEGMDLEWPGSVDGRGTVNLQTRQAPQIRRGCPGLCHRHLSKRQACRRAGAPHTPWSRTLRTRPGGFGEEAGPAAPVCGPPLSARSAGPRRSTLSPCGAQACVRKWGPGRSHPHEAPPNRSALHTSTCWARRPRLELPDVPRSQSPPFLDSQLLPLSDDPLKQRAGPLSGWVARRLLNKLRRSRDQRERRGAGAAARSVRSVPTWLLF